MYEEFELLTVKSSPEPATSDCSYDEFDAERDANTTVHFEELGINIITHNLELHSK